MTGLYFLDFYCNFFMLLAICSLGRKSHNKQSKLFFSHSHLGHHCVFPLLQPQWSWVLGPRKTCNHSMGKCICKSHPRMFLKTTFSPTQEFLVEKVMLVHPLLLPIIHCLHISQQQIPTQRVSPERAYQSKGRKLPSSGSTLSRVTRYQTQNS